MKRNAGKLSLNRETLRHLDSLELERARGALRGTLTYEGTCPETETCPPPATGCASTLSCTE